MDKKIDIAVVGATGVVGEAMLDLLGARKFPCGNVYPLASERSAGLKVKMGGRQIPVGSLEEFDFSRVQIALFSAGASVSAAHVPRAASANCVVIDNTSHFRRDDDVPLVVPEVNAHAIAGFDQRGIIANPNCSTIQMLLAVKPIHDAVVVQRINVATYQAVSGAGREAVENLASQTATLMNGRPLDASGMPQIAFNVVPLIDTLQDNGYTREEMKMVWETQKILDPSIMVNATTVRVPVFYGHSEAVHLETREKISAVHARKILAEAPGVTVIDRPERAEIPTPAVNAVGRDDVFVGRIREDISHPKGLDMWVVSDNIRKGAALNSVQIAEILVESYL
ncbi:MAG: aspartate-semialdehyde dehydrogenase [Gammaproteobacteria bacterium]|nr:aspartate-semialdehyde dehydrogenase [Gammaproteobacteria bacterium]